MIGIKKFTGNLIDQDLGMGTPIEIGVGPIQLSHDNNITLFAIDDSNQTLGVAVGNIVEFTDFCFGHYWKVRCGEFKSGRPCNLTSFHKTDEGINVKSCNASVITDIFIGRQKEITIARKMQV